MSLFYTVQNLNYLRDKNKIPLEGPFPSVTFTGAPGATMAVYEVNPTQAVTGGECTVAETADISTYCAFDPTGNPQGLVVAER